MTDWKSIQKAVQEAEEKRRSETYPTLPEGFTISPLRRCGHIYFRSDDKVLEIPWEMSGVEDYHILILPLEVKCWSEPMGESIGRSERDRIIDHLEEWLKSRKIRADAFAPLKRPLFPNKE